VTQMGSRMRRLLMLCSTGSILASAVRLGGPGQRVQLGGGQPDGLVLCSGILGRVRDCTSVYTFAA